MADLIPIAHRQSCPECEQPTMRVSMLNATSGRTGFLSDSCLECGYICSYSMMAPRPAWHWIVLAAACVVVLMIAAQIGIELC